MRKKENIFALGLTFIIVTTMLTSCSDDFLKEKKDYSKTTSEVYNDYQGAQGRIDNLYKMCLPDGNSGITAYIPSAGTSDDYSKCTEEYAGLSMYVDEGVIISTTSNLPAYFTVETKTANNVYGRIRNANEIIEGVNAGSLSDSQKKLIIGQALFFRAWTYYRLVKIYGGVPLIDKVQNPGTGDDASEGLAVPRSSAKECIDFICNDLAVAATYLPPRWDASNWGRVTAGAALALQGRARLLHASPLFNRADKTDRWETAYQTNKNALDTLRLGGFDLAYLDNPGINAKGWAKMFSEYQTIEAVFITLYNNVATSPSVAPEKYNGWERAIRPSNTMPSASGGKVPSAALVDLFPMSDGSKPNAGNYDPNLFMKDRDPRFYRTFAFAGVRWTFKGNPLSAAGDTVKYPYQGPNYALWNYCWYNDETKKNSPTQGGYGADCFTDAGYKGLYIRKRTDDLDVNSSPLYVDENSNVSTGGFTRCAAPYMEIRFGEVMLNFAEAACGAGHYGEALDALKLIRQRVGYTAANNYGLDPAIAGNRAKLFEAILYERQIELAFEGKRFDDMMRWMLFDGGVGQGALNSTWVLTGFGGNTCAYLGVQPFNGQRRDNLELRVSDAVGNGIAPFTAASDPVKSSRPAAWDLNVSATLPTALEDFYRQKLTRKLRQGDEANKTVQFKPQYYFIGLRDSEQKKNVTLEQNIGWDDAMTNAPGTFDPLVE